MKRADVDRLLDPASVENTVMRVLAAHLSAMLNPEGTQLAYAVIVYPIADPAPSVHWASNMTWREILPVLETMIRETPLEVRKPC